MSQNRSSQQQGLQRRPSNAMVRLPMIETGRVTTNSAQEASQWIEAAYEAGGQVVSPFNHVPDIAPGFGIAYSEVAVKDFDPYGADLYSISGASGRFGLHKAPLDAIGRGYGIDWPPAWTFLEKFNDERDSDPRCLKVTVAGRYRDADGSWKTLPPLTKEIDLREGSPEVVKIRADQEYKETKDLPQNATPEAREARLRTAQRKADSEINQLRKFIRAHAQTKARLQVIRTLVRSSYSLNELQAGPFRIFRVIKNYKAPADRPDLQARMDDLAIERLKDSSDVLYGASVSTRALPPVSDEDSPPPQEDAGVVGEDVGSTGATAAGQGNGGEAASTTVQGDSTQSQPQPKQCTPIRCFGADPAALHVNACYQPAGETASGQEPEVVEEEQPSPWVITRGPAKGLAVNSGKVRPETLKELRNYYLTELDMNGPDFNSLSEERIDLLNGELREVVKELRRRGIKDTGE